MSRDLSVVHTTSSNATTTSTAIVPIRLQNMEVALPADLSVVPETGLVAQDSQDDNFMGDVSNAIESAGAISPSRECYSLPSITMANDDTGMEVVLREVQSPGTSTNTANQPRIQQTAQNQRQTQSEMFPPTTPSSIGSLVPFHEYKP
ncbi:E3 ubiquitin-protein ligase Ubr3 [Eumeta japonica]|uniref:E3 ubiquitin-protein ligase Ubr3 n=1 Tax=Eumeta variegata TaxID=151549 RepID=A0A4C1SUV7_EUMVA|nr:E3 ubiquitin-protein ligase Ubr3 [Eumeta japonica]